MSTESDGGGNEQEKLVKQIMNNYQDLNEATKQQLLKIFMQSKETEHASTKPPAPESLNQSKSKREPSPPQKRTITLSNIEKSISPVTRKPEMPVDTPILGSNKKELTYLQ